MAKEKAPATLGPLASEIALRLKSAPSLAHALFPFLLKYKKTGIETLTSEESSVLHAYIDSLNIEKRRTDWPVIIGIVGLVGAGKTTVARALHKKIGGATISGDDIRIMLREKELPYSHVQSIALQAGAAVLKNGGSLIFDSDHVDPLKRAQLIAYARSHRTSIEWVHVTCEEDTLLARIIKSPEGAGDFFEGASSEYNDDADIKGRAIKIREMERRKPLHKEWHIDPLGKTGGMWKDRAFRIPFIGSIDTTNPEDTERQVEEVHRKIDARY